MARRETHTAWVLLTAAKAYKIKKPVTFGFVDLGTPQRRRHMCEDEVRLNRTLAGGLRARVRALVPDAHGWRLAHPDTAGAVEWLVEMGRYDEHSTLAARAAGQADAPTQDDLERIARRLAAFHAGCPPLHRPRWDAQVAGLMRDNLLELRAADAGVLDRHIADALTRFVVAVADRHGPVLRARGRSGAIREGHVDLRAEHIVVGPQLLIVDRLEFDLALRTLDVADELAFLAMDLEALGARVIGEQIVERYRHHGGDAGSAALRALYGVHRALVRSKVALLRAAQLPDREAAPVHTEARRMLALAERLSWRARDPIVLVVDGPPASGKTTLAHAVAARTGFPVLSSDLVRKELLGLAPTATAGHEAYGPEARRAVYAELGRRTATAFGRGESIIVDATFGSTGLRDAFLHDLGEPAAGGLREIACMAPVPLLARRATARRRRGADASDAGPAVARALAGDRAGLGSARAGRPSIALATTAAPGTLAETVLRQLDDAAPRPG